MICQGQALMEEEYVEPEDEVMTLHKALMNVSAGVTGVLSAQPPNIKGINATKILAAHMLGHAATVVTTLDEKLEVVIVSRKSLKRSKSKIKEQIREISARSPTLSHLSSMSGKMKRGDMERQYVEKALKEVLNIQLKNSLSTPNILRYSGNRGRPKLSEGKRLKFKSEETLNIRERCKGVQTSFSSENLSTGKGNIDYSSSRVSSPFVGSGESLSWSEIMSSEEPSLGRLRDPEKNSSESMFSSSSKPKASRNSNSRNHSYLTSLSQIPTTDASSSPDRFSFGDFTSASEDIVISPSEEIKAENSPNDDSNHILTYTPQMCNIRRFPNQDTHYKGLRDTLKYGSPCETPTAATTSDSGKNEDARSANLKLPFDSPQTESGVMNCYALSPLHY